MNCAIGHGSSGGRCWRSRGKCRMRTRTSSLLQSQKPDSSSRSSSGVSKSDEKTVGVGATATFPVSSADRLRRRGFMTVFPWWKNKGFTTHRTNQPRQTRITEQVHRHVPNSKNKCPQCQALSCLAHDAFQSLASDVRVFQAGATGLGYPIRTSKSLRCDSPVQFLYSPPVEPMHCKVPG